MSDFNDRIDALERSIETHLHDLCEHVRLLHETVEQQREQLAKTAQHTLPPASNMTYGIERSLTWSNAAPTPSKSEWGV